MKQLEYKKNGLVHTPIKFWKTDSDTDVAIYQGERGQNPELDFIVKYKENNKRLRTPSHTHWIVDLLVKSEIGKQDLKNYVDDMIEIYDNSIRFNSVSERSSYELQYPEIMAIKHPSLQGKGYYSVQTLTSFIELFSICEKQNPDAFMFKGLLSLLKQYCNGEKDFYQIVGLSKRV